MTPLHLIRRLHAPLVCLAIACLVSAGCTIREEVVYLGKPSQAYRADNGAILLGYNVKPTPRVRVTLEPATPAYAGWHWLVIEPGTAELIMQAQPRDPVEDSPRVIAVSYEGWGSNARLNPPLLDAGLPDDTPPVVGRGGLTKLHVGWDSNLNGVRLFDENFAPVSLVQVSPDSATLTIREYDRDKGLVILQIAAVAGLIVGLVFLGGSGSISF